MVTYKSLQQTLWCSTNLVTNLVRFPWALHTSEVILQEADHFADKMLLVGERHGVIVIGNRYEFDVRKSLENRRIIFRLDEHRLATGDLENRSLVGRQRI